VEVSSQPYHDHLFFEDGRVFLIYSGGQLGWLIDTDASAVKPEAQEQVLIESTAPHWSNIGFKCRVTVVQGKCKVLSL
jgi:hypothetical protein